MEIVWVRDRCLGIGIGFAFTMFPYYICMAAILLAEVVGWERDYWPTLRNRKLRHLAYIKRSSEHSLSRSSVMGGSCFMAYATVAVGVAFLLNPIQGKSRESGCCPHMKLELVGS